MSNAFVFAADRTGLELGAWLLEQYPDKIAGTATVAGDGSRFRAQIDAALGEAGGHHHHRALDPNASTTIETIRASGATRVFLLWVGTIIKGSTIAATQIPWVNLHPSLLPWGRGKHGYYWSIVEGTPFGATIHLIDENIDQGRILFQETIPTSPASTGQELYTTGVVACARLFKDNIAALLHDDLLARSWAPTGKGTFHRARELSEHSRIDPAGRYVATDLLDILRARSFPDGESLRIRRDGRIYEIRVDIREVADEGTYAPSDPSARRAQAARPKGLPLARSAPPQPNSRKR